MLKKVATTLAILGLSLGLIAGIFFWQDNQPLPETAPQPRKKADTLPPGPVRLIDVTKPAKIDFQHNNGSFGAKWIIESLGSGAAFFDYDNDGDPDLFLVNGRNWTDVEVAAYRNGPGREHETKFGFKIPANRPPMRTTGTLYRNRGDGTFENATNSSGLDVEMYGLGAAVADFDNDGFLDLFVTALNRNYLFRNRGNGQFDDVTKKQNLLGRGLNTSAAWLDYDCDGRLDLFVCRYVLWSPALETTFMQSSLGKVYNGPLDYRSDVSALYRNTGHGFEDVSQSAGISVRKTKKGGSEPITANGLGVLVHDFNRDGWPDIAVASDLVPNLFFCNKRDGTFQETALAANFVYSYANHVRAGMGIDSGDFAGNGQEHILVGNFSREGMGLYRPSHQKGDDIIYEDVAARYEVQNLSELFVTFGAQFVDLDNDGWLDIFTANGHVRDDADLDPNFVDHGDITYAQRPFFFWNRGAKQPVQDVGFEPNKPQPEIVGRGLACADIDLDGDTDVLITGLNSVPLLLRNDDAENAIKNQAVRLVLQSANGNQDAIGAQIEAKVGNRTVRRTLKSGYSYLSHSELPLTLGLGPEKAIASLKISWPSGARTEYKNLKADTAYIIHEKRGIQRQNPLKHP